MSESAVVPIVAQNFAGVGPAVGSDGLFYAYIVDRRVDGWRITIVFGSRDIADDWWRHMTGSDFPKLQSIQRVAPQLYTHDPVIFNFYTFFVDADVKPVADKYRGRMFFVLENDTPGRGISIIPSQSIVDHTSGSSFSIRSKSDPRLYWDIDAEGHIYVTVSKSYNDRTSFVVTANNVAQKTIMIGSDQVTLSTSRGAVVLEQSSPAGVAPFSFVKTSASDAANVFTFKDLKEGKLFVDRKTGYLCLSDQAKSGTAWELAL